MQNPSSGLQHSTLRHLRSAQALPRRRKCLLLVLPSIQDTLVSVSNPSLTEMLSQIGSQVFHPELLPPATPERHMNSSVTNSPSGPPSYMDSTQKDANLFLAPGEGPASPISWGFGKRLRSESLQNVSPSILHCLSLSFILISRRSLMQSGFPH